MPMAWRWLSRGLIVLLIGVLLLAAVWTYGRLTSPTESQREAVAVMQAQLPMPEGDNGFDLLMALPPAPESPWPTSLQCYEASACLDAAQSASAEDVATLQLWRPRLEVAERALHAPAFRDTREHAPFNESAPAFRDVMRLDSLRALQFAAGQTGQALDNACTDALGASRLAAEPDSFFPAMIGIAVFRKQAALIADMRSRAPTDTLPASCMALAKAPDPAVEASFCAVIRGEWRYQQRTLSDLTARIKQEQSALMRLGSIVVHDLDWHAATAAEAFSSACTDEARLAAREDHVYGFVAPKIRWVDRVAYAASSILMDISLTGYTFYFERQLDHVARRRLLAALLQMDAMDVTLTSQQRFDSLPAELRDGPRPLALAADGSAMTVPISSRRAEEQEPDGARLPLPPAASPSAPLPRT